MTASQPLRWVFCILVTVSFMPLHASAQSFFGGGTYRNSSSGGENVTWTLGDWMTQKARFKLMDQWLAVNKQANLIEFNVEGGKTNYDLTVGGSTSSQEVDRYSASLYISIFGIEGGYEESDENIERRFGQFNIRILGQSSRSTQLVAGYGVQKTEDTDLNTEVTNQYATGKLQLYLVSFLGLEGAYKKTFRANDNLGSEHEGERVEYGVFLEHKMIRIYGRAFEDKTFVTTSGNEERQTRDGVDAGIKLFF